MMHSWQCGRMQGMMVRLHTLSTEVSQHARKHKELVVRTISAPLILDVTLPGCGT
jgi:hypothetical protein